MCWSHVKRIKRQKWDCPFTTSGPTGGEQFREWYQTRLGYQVQVEFVEQGQLMGYALHPNGRPPLGLRRDPGRARAAAGF